jgi:hypothetical protein
MKPITLKYLESVNACAGGVKWWKSLKTTDFHNIMEASLASDDKEIVEYGNWLLSQIFTPEQRIQYAIFAAEQVLSIFESNYPEDSRPRKAIEAAQAHLDNPSVETAHAAHSAARAAYTAAHTAHSAADAAYAAANAADAAANAADAAANAADAAAYAAYAVARAAYAVARAANAAARLDTYKKIVRYGMTLLEEEK